MDHQELQEADGYLPSHQVAFLRHHLYESDHQGSPLPPGDGDSEPEVASQQEARKLPMPGLSAPRRGRADRDEGHPGRFLSEAEGHLLRVRLRVSPLRPRLPGSQKGCSDVSRSARQEESHDRHPPQQRVDLSERHHHRVSDVSDSVRRQSRFLRRKQTKTFHS